MGLRGYIYGKSKIPLCGVNVWIGTADQDWFTATNWSLGRVPKACDDVIINFAPNAPHIGINSPIAFASTLVVQAGATLFLEGSLTVEGKVTTNGTITAPYRGSLIQNDDYAVNDGSGVMTVGVPTTVYLNDYTYWSSPTHGTQTGQSFTPDSNLKYFLTYDNKWSYTNASKTTFTPGVGYAILSPKDSNGGTWTGQFRGTPNNGVVNIPLTYNLPNSSRLVGNPYPSPLSSRALILANQSKIIGTIAIWTHSTRVTSGGYSTNNYIYLNLFGTTRSRSGLYSVHTEYIRPGDGFIIEPRFTTTLTFDNSMRTHSLKVPAEANLSSRHRIWLNLTNGDDDFYQALLGYAAGCTDGVDYGYDHPGQGEGTGIYVMNGGIGYTISARGAFTNTDVFDIGFKTNYVGSHTIAIDRFDGLFSGAQAIYLVDTLLNVTTNLKTSGYTFPITTIGSYNTRFKIKFLP